MNGQKKARSDRLVISAWGVKVLLRPIMALCTGQIRPSEPAQIPQKEEVPRRASGQPGTTAARRIGRVITSSPAPSSIRPRPRRPFFSLAEPVRARLAGPAEAPSPAAEPDPAAEPAAVDPPDAPAGPEPGIVVPEA